MKILCVGDVVGNFGVEYLNKSLIKLKKSENIDCIIVNGENSASHNGISPQSADEIFSMGVDVITTGNHVYRRKEIYEYIESNDRLLRPVNYPDNIFGAGYCFIDKISYEICVINIMGTIFMENLENPFHCIDKVLEKIHCKNIIIDFHGEATSEKICFANYVDGRVTAVLGTHTHVQTADERILPKGTAFITDMGMVGVIDSAIGMDFEPIMAKYLTGLPQRFKMAEGKCQFNGIMLDIDESTGKARLITRINIKEN